MRAESNDHEIMDRRTAMRRLGTLLLGGVTLSSIDAVFDARCALAAPSFYTAPLPFSTEEVALLDEIAETILPETDTPGAKAAGVGAFIALMFTDVLNPAQQRVFRAGIATIQDASRADGGFHALPPASRRGMLEHFDREQYEHTHADDAPAHWFRMLKGLTLFGYFTSEIGYTKALRYVEAPGRFEPAVTRASGERSWAKHGSDVGGGRVPGLVNARRQCRAR